MKFHYWTPNEGRRHLCESCYKASCSIRLYDSGNGPAVECASCHDPHGVPSGGSGTVFNATFLRKTNAGSAVCLTCHDK